jgi:NADPH2 dehydrogenase
LITKPLQAQNILLDNHADAVFLGREMLRNPRWPLYAAEQLNVDTFWPVQIKRGKAN